MSNSSFRWCVLIVSLFSYSHAVIIKGTDIVLYNQNIEFNSHSITANPLIYQQAGFVYLCAASAPQMDMFVAQELLGVCTFICHSLAVGSPRPFYTSKTAFDSVYFSVMFPNLNDTTRLTLCDTVRNDLHVHDNTHCYLPHVGNGALSSIPIKPGYCAIFRNSWGSMGRYILARFDTIMAMSTVCEPTCTSYPYLKGYRIRWYLQDNGTPDFRGFANIIDNPPPQSVIRTTINKKLFSISGRQLEAESPSQLNVVIERDASGIARKRIAVPAK
jgi:hypothetical protein